MHAKLLDCTLRDGGYVVDKYFGETEIRGIIKGLLDANLDVIECGFLDNDVFKPGYTHFNNAAQIVPYLPKNRGNASYVCLADYSRYDIDNLEPYDKTSIDGVRACFFKKERYDVLEFCRKIKEKGYTLYVQPVDILGYTDSEIIELIEMVNPLQPDAFSIVDTFGSMFKEDLQRIFHLVHHNLMDGVKMGFHSHNNMQMSFALSQEFISMSQGLRQVVVDATMCGMGRGAGNTNTELMMSYMNKKYNTNYNIDEALDVIDNYIASIRSEHEWGYSIPYYIAGMYSAHVNNISYLLNKAGIISKDVRYILNKIGPVKCKRYDYELLEDTYVEFLGAAIDDSASIAKLRQSMEGREVLVVLPGKSILEKEQGIATYIQEKNPVVIGVNLIRDIFKMDYIYFSNKRRHDYWVNDKRYAGCKKIIASNVTQTADNTTTIVDFTKLIKCGWVYLDNSGIMLLRLLDQLGVSQISIAGFDGYDSKEENYAKKALEKKDSELDVQQANADILSMLNDYRATRALDCPVTFITPSRFSSVFE